MSNTKTVMSQAANTLTAPLNVEDVFSTYLYTGNSSAQTITNGIDLDGEGGLWWLKRRSGTGSHALYDSERSTASGHFPLFSNNTVAEYDDFDTTPTSSGFIIGSTSSGTVNESGQDYASWTFRKAPKFFDVVTFTGDGTNGRLISHNLGSVPGVIITKPTSQTDAWNVYHRSLSDDNASWCQNLFLNTTDPEGGYGRFSPHASQTDTHFSLYNDGNKNGVTYVAYLFAHNDGDGGFNGGDIIKCGSYTGNGSSDGPEIDLGFEPQWLLVKNASGVSNWLMVDSMRGFPVGSDNARLFSNLTNAEAAFNGIDPTATGFKLVNSTGGYNTSGNDYIYIAIRRGTKVPESATEVFAPNFYGTSGYVGYLGAPADMSMLGYRNGNSQNAIVSSRLVQGNKALVTSSTAAEITSNSSWDNMSGVTPVGTTLSTLISWTWKRAPNFFDVVAYTGDGVAGRTVSHNLGVAPEMIWVKCRDATIGWQVYHAALGNTGGLYLNTTTNPSPVNWWNNTDPSSTSFSLGLSTGNNAGLDFIAYLFATLDGISKVGSYTGTGSQQVIDCGFTSGARFILTKRTDNLSNWIVCDTERGIVSGNDPFLALDATSAEGSQDIFDPNSVGFEVTSNSNANASGASYIFYAVA